MKALTLIGVMWVAIAQPSSPSFAGSWIAQFEGRTFVRLELSEAKGTVRGFIGLGNIEFDKASVVRKAGDVPRALKAVGELSRRDAVLTFAMRNPGETDRFELKLIDANNAELRILLSDEDRQELIDEGIPLPGPIRLTKK